MNIKSILYNDMSKLSEDEQIAMNIFNEKLREELIKALVSDVKKSILESIKRDKCEFDEMINNMIINGYKGLKDMNTQTILNLYLEKKSEMEFINLIEKIKIQ